MVKELLTNKEPIWDSLPGELSSILARCLLYNHAVNYYLFEQITLPSKTLLGCGCAQFNKDGDKLVTASTDNTAKVWDVASGECLATLAGHTAFLYTANFTNAGDKIVTASFDGTVKIWDVETGTCLSTLQGHTKYVVSAQFNRVGDKVVTASYDRTAKIWDVETGTCLSTLQGHTDMVNSAQFNGAGDKVVTGSDDRTAKIWDVETGTCLATLQGHTGFVNSAQFNGAGDKVVTSTDKTARIWDIRALCEVSHFLSKDATLQHAFILHAVYEVMITRMLAKKQGAKNVETLTFDFAKCPHLEKYYEGFPESIQRKLAPYITKQPE